MLWLFVLPNCSNMCMSENKGDANLIPFQIVTCANFYCVVGGVGCFVVYFAALSSLLISLWSLMVRCVGR